MAINFPSSPVLNDEYTYLDRTWKWNGFAWDLVGTVKFLKFTRSPSAPSSPSEGDRWLNTSDGVEYTWYVDVDSSQWVEL